MLENINTISVSNLISLTDIYNTFNEYKRFNEKISQPVLSGASIDRNFLRKKITQNQSISVYKTKSVWSPKDAMQAKITILRKLQKAISIIEKTQDTENFNLQNSFISLMKFKS